MKKQDTDLVRLLRSAARAPEEGAPELPFGFETRVVASWRAGKGEANGLAELTPFLRRIEAIAIAVVLLAGVGVYRQFNENLAQVTAQTNEYAIADSAIQNRILSMNGSLKWKLAFALLLVFVAGGTTGGLLCSIHARRHFFGPPHSGAIVERFREHLQRALDLTPEQATKIAPVIDSTSAKLEAIRVDTAQRVRSTMEEAERQISPELTPDQQKKLQEMKSAHQKMMMRHGFMPPPPPPPESPAP